ncbi:uncharacterized protein [Venturia canescens]|uniref:uncharacterized protein n=1 Tax=Venturia canescens TaxID=32260 RepID=UPI001C9C8A03|nr:uncharacterized protein LOC122416805 [Venturia canescens]
MSVSKEQGEDPPGSLGSRTRSRIETTANKATPDALTVEFHFGRRTLNFGGFRGAIRNLALAITDPSERARAVLWINKLFGAEYHVEVLRDKRNRYLAALTVSMINDELIGIFAEDPPVCALRDITKMQILPAPVAEWENDTTWADFVSTLPDNCKEVNSMIHTQSFHCGDEMCKQASVDMGQQLDSEFLFLLYQMRPYAALMPCRDYKTKVAAWMQTLCRLGCMGCDKMRALRNDYAYSLYGYVRDLRVAGPFQDFPPKMSLPSLCEAAKAAAKKHPLTSPFSEEANAFLEVQPNLEDGAFCYFAITGDFANPDSLLPP